MVTDKSLYNTMNGDKENQNNKRKYLSYNLYIIIIIPTGNFINYLTIAVYNIVNNEVITHFHIFNSVYNNIL